MNVEQRLNELISTGRLIFDRPMAEILRRELLGIAPGRPVAPALQKLIVAICEEVPETTLRVSSLYRAGDSHHAEGRAVDFGNEEVAGLLLPLVATQEFVDEQSVDEVIFDASTLPGRVEANRYNFDEGRPHIYDAATLSQHRNHIHFSVRR